MEFKPEIFYENESLTKNQLKYRFEKGELVSFQILGWNENKKALFTSFGNDILGNNILGYIPESELCIEKLKYLDGFSYSVQAHSMIGKTACALITSITENEIMLSRKKLQEKVFQTFVIGKNYNVHIKNLTNIGIFADIAVGIPAFIHNSEISKTLFNSVEDLKKDFGLYRDKIIPAKLISSTNNIKMSFRQALSSPFFNKGDVVYGIVRNVLSNGTGYFLDLSPNDTAIVDTDFKLYYGDRILVQIKSSESTFEGREFHTKHHVKPIAR